MSRKSRYDAIEMNRPAADQAPADTTAPALYQALGENRSEAQKAEYASLCDATRGSMGTTVELHDDDCLVSPPYEIVDISCPGTVEEYEIMHV